MSSLQMLVSDQDANAADPTFTIELLKSEPLFNKDNDEPDDDLSANAHHPVQRSLSQLSMLHQQYAAINTTCILPAFPSNTSSMKNRLDRYYKKLFMWAPEIRAMGWIARVL